MEDNLFNEKILILQGYTLRNKEWQKIQNYFTIFTMKSNKQWILPYKWLKIQFYIDLLY